MAENVAGDEGLASMNWWFMGVIVLSLGQLALAYVKTAYIVQYPFYFIVYSHPV
jgi:hypothetical protein